MSTRLNGQKHEGTRIGLWVERFQPLTARKIANDYRAKPTRSVFYDPSNPNRSLLEQGVGAGTWSLAALTVLGLVFCGIFWPQVIRFWRTD
jgi:hypothetical protein